MRTVTDESDALIAQQRWYYDERAPDFLDPTKPSDRKDRGNPPHGLMASLIDEFAPAGDVLELACGDGASTKYIVRHAESLTAVDGSPRMIERNQETVTDAKADYVVADIFEWKPDRKYDAVVFTFWLSHVPPTRFDEFWQLVRDCIRPHGRVCFIDEDDRAAGKEHDARVVDAVPVAKRTLVDGRAFDIIKVFWNTAELEGRLRSAGWDIDVRPVGDSFLFGAGSPK